MSGISADGDLCRLSKEEEIGRTASRLQTRSDRLMHRLKAEKSKNLQVDDWTKNRRNNRSIRRALVRTPSRTNAERTAARRLCSSWARQRMPLSDGADEVVHFGILAASA